METPQFPGTWHIGLEDGLKIFFFQSTYLCPLFLVWLFAHSSYLIITLSLHSHTTMHSELPLFHSPLSDSLPFYPFLLPPDILIEASVQVWKKTTSTHRLSEVWKKKRKNFVKGACWENSSLPEAASILDLDWWVSTPRRWTHTAHLHVCMWGFWGVSVCKCSLGGWKAVSNSAKMPGTGDYWSPSRPLSPTTINEGELSFYQPGHSNTMHLCYL